MTAGWDPGSIRASDSDRSQAQSLLNDAYADGRLTQQEWEERATVLAGPVTHADLARLTADLPSPYPVPQPAPPPPAPYSFQTSAQPRRNSMATASLVCGLGQMFFPPFPTIAAIVLGHKARRQIRQTGEQGDGFAVAGLILGYIGLGVVLLAVLAVLFLVVVNTSSGGGGMVVHRGG
jgi:hypothetical protein